MGSSCTRAAVGFAGAAFIATMARRAHALTPGGAVAATVVGGAVVTGSGRRGATALVTFFLSSTMLGRLPAARDIAQRRGNERDAVRVLANGGVAAVLAVAAMRASQRACPLLMAGFGGAVAAATADTWATEVGSRSRQRPRSIATLRPVPPGASGGVTWAGLAASAAGAALIAALTSGGACRTPGHAYVLAVPVALGGMTGALADSILGATVQEVRFCDRCNLESELRAHDCGALTRAIRGAPWCNNDTVNAMATIVGAVTAVIIQVVMEGAPVASSAGANA